MSSLQTILHWVNQGPFAAAAVLGGCFFAWAILSLAVYTYFYDYKY